MAVNTTTINGDVFLPDGAVREKSFVIFEQTGFDTDANDDATIVTFPIRAAIADDGAINQDLWPNQEGVRTTFYRVTFEIHNGTKPHLVDGGKISVPVSGGPYALNDLLPIAPPAGVGVDEYIAQLAAAVLNAETAAGDAEAAAADAEADADRAEAAAPNTPEKHGAVGDGVADDLPAIQAMLDEGGTCVLGAGWGDVVPDYRCSTAPVVNRPVRITGTRSTDRMTIDNSNTEYGLFINSSDVIVDGFEIMANASTGIENGTGHKGTCITISEWFTDPRLPEPPLIKRVVIQNMRLTRKSGSKAGHAISILGRTSGVIIDNCDFIGNSPVANDGCHADAVLTHWGAHTHGVSTTQISYDGKTSNFTAGETLTGGTSGATAYIVDDDDGGATGTLWLKLVSGDFVDSEAITDTLGGAAVADGPSTVGLRQSRFEPDHYSYHPNNVKITNCRLRNVGRFIACSASYSIHADNIDYLGPVQGGQLIDLPIGDEGATFAHPDDYGRVYDNFSFTNITGKMMTGTGANAVTAIDCSGFSTSKQTDADLAAYASAPYTDEAYAGVAHGKRRTFKWQNVRFENIVFDAGPSDPPSATPYVRTIYLRNLWGNFTFENVTGVGRDSVLSLELANVVGNYSFNNCDFIGGVSGYATENVHFRGCNLTNPDTDAGTQAVLWGGGRSTVFADGPVSLGETVIPITSGCPVRIMDGQRLTFNGGMVTCARFAEIGDTEILITPAPVAIADMQAITVDQWSRNTSFTDCAVRGGDEGFSIAQSIGFNLTGGTVRDAGQYGLLLSADSEVYATGVVFSGNGLRRITDGGLSTRDIVVNPDATLIAKMCRFDQSSLVLYNIVSNSSAERVSISDCVFAGNPITGKTNLAALANGQPYVFVNNTDGIGLPVRFGGTWSPDLTLGNGNTGLSYTVTTAKYAVTGDYIHLNFDISLTAKGSSTGQLNIGNLPHAVADGSAGSLMAVSGVTLDGTGGLVLRVTGGVLRCYEQATTGIASLQHDNLTDTSRLIGSVTARLD